MLCVVCCVLLNYHCTVSLLCVVVLCVVVFPLHSHPVVLLSCAGVAGASTVILKSACCALKQHEADAGWLLVRQVGGQAKQKNRQVVKTGETDRWLYCKDKQEYARISKDQS